MPTIKSLEKEIELIKNRNRKVEADKEWETSWNRKLLISFFTYLVILSFFVVAKLPNPFISALIPCIGFLLSTMTLSFAKDIFMKNRK
jgi:polyferredoxin